MIKDKLKLDLLNKQLTKLIDDSKKPMSIIQIKEKYNLCFPFRVKRVRFSPVHMQDIYKSVGSIFTISEITRIADMSKFTKNSTPNHTNNRWTEETWQSADLEDYILFEEN